MAQTVEDWEVKGWQSAEIPPGGTVDVTFDPATQKLVIKGVFDDSGNQITGSDKPKVTTTATATGASIGTEQPAEASVTVVYKVVDKDEEEEPEPQE